MKKHLKNSLCLFLCAVLLLSLVPVSAFAYGNTANIGTGGAPTYLEYKENGTWHDLNLPAYELNAEDVNRFAYAMTLDGTDPGGSAYSAEALSSHMTEAVKKGAEAILAYGYPSVYPDLSELSVSEAAAATQAALLFWFAEKGVEGVPAYLNRRTSEGSLRAKSGSEPVLSLADALLARARAGALPEHALNVSTENLVLTKNGDGSYSGTFDISLQNLDLYWLSANGMPSSVSMTGSTSVSDCTVRIDAPAEASGSDFTLELTGFTRADAQNWTVYVPSQSGEKKMLYHEGAEIAVCSASVHVTVPGTGRIRIYEHDESGKAASGSKWGVYRDSACTDLIASVSITVNGFGNTPYLDSGSAVYVRQISSVEPYLLDADVYPAVIENGGQTALRFTAKRAAGKLVVSASGTRITGMTAESSDYGTVYTLTGGTGGTEGAVFTVTGPDGYETSVTTGADGTAVLTGLSFGTYTAVQTSAPSGISYDSAAQTAQILYGGGTVPEVTAEITARNDMLTGSAKIKKTTERYDRDNRVFLPVSGSGFRFGLYAAEANGIVPKDALLEILTTDADGGAESEVPVPYGSYYFRELSVPDERIHMSQESFPFTLSSSTNTAYAETPFENEMHKCWVSVYLTDSETGAAVEGAVFQVLGTDDGFVYDEFRTDADGYGCSCALPVGDYILKMLTPAPGYALDPTENAFSITTETKSAVVFEKEADGIRMHLRKTDADTGEGLAGALLTVRNDSGDTVFSGRTDANGLLELNLIPAGSYTFRETEPPAGYALDGTPRAFTVADDGTVTGETTLTNRATSLLVTVTDTYTNTRMPGIRITLKDADGNPVYTKDSGNGYRVPAGQEDGTDSFLSGTNGTAVVRFLPAGSYTVLETAPEGYITNAPLACSLTDAHSVNSPLLVNLTNTPTGLTVLKTDAKTGNPLTGAGFTVKVKNGNGYASLSFTKQQDGSYRRSESGSETLLMVDGSGRIDLVGVPLGDLWIEESVTPDGYFPISAQKVTLTDANTFAEPLRLTVKNSKYVKLGMDSDWWEFPALCLGILVLLGGTVFVIRKKRKKKEISLPLGK